MQSGVVTDLESVNLYIYIYLCSSSQCFPSVHITATVPRIFVHFYHYITNNRMVYQMKHVSSIDLQLPGQFSPSSLLHIASQVGS